MYFSPSETLEELLVVERGRGRARVFLHDELHVSVSAGRERR